MLHHLFVNWKSLIIVGLSLLNLVRSECGVPVLIEGAAGLVKASFKQRFRRTDFTKIDVDLTPYNLVEDGACLNSDLTSLLYNNDGGDDWTAVEEKPMFIVAGQYKFSLDDIVPCKDYYFRLILSGEGGSLVGLL